MVRSSGELIALVVTPDSEMLAIFTHLFREMNVTTQPGADAITAARMVAGTKFDALVIDLDQIADESQIVESSRSNRANRDAMVIVVASDTPLKERAQVIGATFVLERPFVPSQIGRVLNVAYGLMLQWRREYFRLAITLDVSARLCSGTKVQCETINVSRTGMAVSTPTPLKVGETLDVVFSLPTPGPEVIAQAQVIWDDKHGKAGFHLHYPNSQVQDRVSEWLDSELYQLVRKADDRVASLQAELETIHRWKLLEDDAEADAVGREAREMRRREILRELAKIHAQRVRER